MRSTLFVLIVALAACSESEAPASQGKGPQGPPPATVVLGSVEAGSVSDGWVFLGKVKPALSAEIAAAAAGRVLEVTVREGDEVSKKKRLVRLDSAEVSARLAAAKAKLQGIETELELAERQRERIEKLDYPTVSEPEKERFQLAAQNLRAQKATQQAEVRRLQVEYGHHTVSAPFAGTVKARHVDPGAWVNIGQPIVELVSTGELEIHVDVSAQLGARLKVGETGTLIGPTRSPARIAGVVPALDASTGTMRIRLVTDDRPSWLIAGMPVDVEFTVTYEGDGVTVSPDALVRGPVDTKVIKHDAGKGVPVPVEIIAVTVDRALVRGDLKPGDRVVVRGNERLRPGQPLQVKE